MTVWKPSVTPTDVIQHSQGPWEEHKYVKKVDDKYYYPNSYEDGRTVSDLKDNDKSSNKAEKGTNDEKYSEKDRIGDTEFFGFKNKDGRTVIVEEDKKWTLPEGKKLDASLKKRLAAIEKEIADRRERGEKVDSDEWNRLVDEAINGTGKKSKGKKSGSKSSGKKSGSSKGSSKDKKQVSDKERRAKNKQTMKSRTEEQQKEKERRMKRNLLNGKAYLNHSFWAPTDELYHHGILGQSWGHRNGPPYPLDSSDYSKAEKRAARKAAHKEKSEARKAKKQQKHEIAAQKKAVKEEAKRQKILKTGSLKEVRKLKGNISNAEYTEVFKRLENEQKLDDFDKEQKKNFAVKVKSAQSVVSDLDKGSAAAVNLYNRGATIYNVLAKKKHWTPEELPLIKDQNQNQNNEKKK